MLKKFRILNQITEALFQSKQRQAFNQIIANKRPINSSSRVMLFRSD